MMQTLYLGAAVVLALLLAAPLWRIVRGPTLFDRLVGASMLGTKTIVLLMLMGQAGERLDMYLDISLGYGLALMGGTLVAAKYLEQAARKEREEGTPPRTPEITEGEQAP